MTPAAPHPLASQDGIPVDIRGLVHIYTREGRDVAALAGVTLHVAAGEVLALIGPSGSGKSTLMAILAGLLRPSAGTVRLGDIDLTTASTTAVERYRRAHVAVILQDVRQNLLPHLSVWENAALTYLGQHRHVPDLSDILTLIGIPETDWHQPVHRLPASTRQLTAIAAAVACQPGLILADEPTSHLCGDHAHSIITALRSITAATGATLIAVTHDTTVAHSLGRTVTIKDGRVGSEGRNGRTLSVVGSDGAVGLPPDALHRLPPGSLVDIAPHTEGWLIRPWHDHT